MRAVMRIEHLLTFVTVADEGNITKAANKLFRTQPAISTQLKQLTEAFGEPLYTKYAEGVKLTEAGEGLLVHARAIARAYESTKLYINDYKNLGIGTLKLVASLTIGVYLLPQLLTSFNNQHQDLNIQLNTRYSKEALDILLQGQAEIAFVEIPLDELKELDSSFSYTEFYKDEIVLVTNPSHPLAKLLNDDSLNIMQELQNHTIVWAEASSGTRHVVEGMLEQQSIELEKHIQVTGIEAIKRAVRGDLGIAFLSRLAVIEELESGQLVQIPLEQQNLERSFTLIHPQLEVCSHRARAFIDFFKKQVYL